LTPACYRRARRPAEHSLAVHLPAVLATVVVTTLIILFLMTGSVLLPIKAVVMNALGLSAMFGILVLLFQDGNLEGVLSYHGLGALDATQPILLFAVALGAFSTSEIVFIKELGLGAVLAVLIDASIIRALLVPSLMMLLGPLNS
jgi:RND superfamily putative drug exporter